jgi:hypothetical protein
MHQAFAADRPKPVQVIEHDLSDPMAIWEHRLYGTKSFLRGKPTFRAGVSQNENRAVTGETAPETDTAVRLS